MIFENGQTVVLTKPITDWAHGDPDDITVPSGAVGTVRKAGRWEYLIAFLDYPSAFPGPNSLYYVSFEDIRPLSPLEQLAAEAEETNPNG